jgi:hypothetical protein
MMIDRELELAGLLHLLPKMMKNGTKSQIELMEY